MTVFRKLFFFSLLALAGCSSTLSGWKSKLMGEDSSPIAKEKNKNATRFLASDPAADDPASKVPKRKQDPFDQTGPYNEASLWNGDTQDNFYFTKNVLHKVGDILIVKMDPEVTDALNLKISAALGRSSIQDTVADEAGKAAGTAAAEKVGKAVGNGAVGKAVGEAVQDRTTAAIEERPRYVDVDEMSVRITEMLPRNSYRIEGTKRVFIKNLPYNLKYSGVVRDEDVGPASLIASAKVIDSKMEMVK